MGMVKKKFFAYQEIRELRASKIKRDVCTFFVWNWNCLRAFNIFRCYIFFDHCELWDPLEN